MALQGLYPVLPDGAQHRSDTMTKTGYPIYDGNPAMFSEWEFRTMLKIKTTKEDDKDKICSSLVEALHGKAASVAQDIGTEKLSEKDGFLVLIEALKKDAFPRMDKEARDLLREGQKPRGVLSRSNGESMKAYTDRRDRWWRRLKSLNSSIQVSEDILSQWMLDSANISETEKQLVQTTAKNEWKIGTISHALQVFSHLCMKKKVAQQHLHVNRDSHMHHHKETGTRSDFLLGNLHIDLLNIVTVNLKEKVCREDSHDEHTTLTRYPMTMMTMMMTMRTNTKYLPQITHHSSTKTNTTVTPQLMT